jgi:hypothetical protein
MGGEGKSVMNFVKIIFPTKLGLGDMNLYQSLAWPQRVRGKYVRRSINILDPNKLTKLDELVDVIARRFPWVTFKKRTTNHGQTGNQIKIWFIHD